MKLDDVSDVVDKIIVRMSGVVPSGLQLVSEASDESVSVAVTLQSEGAGFLAVLSVDEDRVRVLKLGLYDDIRTEFSYSTRFELFVNILTLVVLCFRVIGYPVSAVDAVSAALRRRIGTWRDLISHICTLTVADKDHIAVRENGQNALRLLRTSLFIRDGVFYTRGMYNSAVGFSDTLELLRAALDALAVLLKINDIDIDPFFDPEDPTFTGSDAAIPMAPPVGMAGSAMPPVPGGMDMGSPDVGSMPPMAPAGMDASGFPEPPQDGQAPDLSFLPTGQ